MNHNYDLTVVIVNGFLVFGVLVGQKERLEDVTKNVFFVCLFFHKCLMSYKLKD